MLRLVADRLSSVVRPSDTVARLGGDEFVVILPATAREGAVRLSRRMIARVAEPMLVEGRVLSVAASIGIAVHPTHGDVDGLMLAADRAMYLAKPGRQEAGVSRIS